MFESNRHNQTLANKTPNSSLIFVTDKTYTKSRFRINSDV